MNTPIKRDEEDLWLLTRYGAKPRHAGHFLGIPPRRVAYLCEKWARQGKYDYGVTVDLGWATDRPFEGVDRVRGAVLVPPIQAEQVAAWFDVPVELLTGDDQRQMRPVPFETPAAWAEPDLTEVRRVAEKAAQHVRNATAQAVERIKAAQGPAVKRAIDPRRAFYEDLLAEFVAVPVSVDRGGVRYPTPHYTIAADGQITDHTAELAQRVQRSNRG